MTPLVSVSLSSSPAATGAATTSAWFAAVVTGTVGVITISINAWIAYQQRRLERRKPNREQAALAIRDRDVRAVALIESAEYLRTQCWEVDRVCTRNVSATWSMAHQMLLADLSERLIESNRTISSRWAPLRADLNDIESDRLLFQRISCAESVDDVILAIALTGQDGAIDSVALRSRVEDLYRKLDGFVRDIGALRSAWLLAASSA